MTGEEIISNLLYMKRSVKEDTIEDRTIDEVIKALEQEPCEDCVSREAVLKITAETGALETQARVKELPPVTPKQRTGKWITWKEAGNYIPSETRFECSECHDAAQTLCNGLDLLSPFCPNCGAKMEGVSE